MGTVLHLPQKQIQCPCGWVTPQKITMVAVNIETVATGVDPHFRVEMMCPLCHVQPFIITYKDE